MRVSKVSPMIRTVCRCDDVVSRHVSTGCGFACFSSVMHKTITTYEGIRAHLTGLNERLCETL